MSNLETRKAVHAAAIEAALIENDLSKLTTEQRLQFYKSVCDSVGLNHLTQPLSYIVLNGKLTLYAKKDAADQLRKIHGVSIRLAEKKTLDGIYMVTAEAIDQAGRRDEATGVVPTTGLRGVDLANAMLKAETKAKRRVTLSICGLGILDETEVSDIPRGKTAPFDSDPFGKRQAALDDKIAELSAPVHEEVPQESPSGETEEDLGEYVVKVGKKFPGQRLKDIDQFELASYIKWIVDSNSQRGKEPTGDYAELVQAAEAYLVEREFTR